MAGKKHGSTDPGAKGALQRHRRGRQRRRAPPLNGQRHSPRRARASTFWQPPSPAVRSQRLLRMRGSFAATHQEERGFVARPPCVTRTSRWTPRYFMAAPDLGHACTICRCRLRRSPSRNGCSRPTTRLCWRSPPISPGWSTYDRDNPRVMSSSRERGHLGVARTSLRGLHCASRVTPRTSRHTDRWCTPLQKRAGGSVEFLV